MSKGMLSLGLNLMSVGGGALAANDPTLIIPHQTFYSKGNYSVYTFNFALAGTPTGATHDAYWTIYPSTFPDRPKLSWKVPQGAIPFGLGVWGYHHLDYGNYDTGAQQVPPAPVMICDLVSYAQTFDYSYTGSVDFGLLAEEWLTWRASTSGGNSNFSLTGTFTSGNPTITGITSTAGVEKGSKLSGTNVPSGARILSFTSTTITMSGNASGSGTNAFNTSLCIAETGALLHANDRSFHDSNGTLVGVSYVSNGITYTVKSHQGYYTVMPLTPQDILGPSFDRLAFWKHMMLWGEITGSEWVNGTGFGVEPNFQAGSGTHSGELTINSYKVTPALKNALKNQDYLGDNLLAPLTFSGGNPGTGTPVTSQPDLDGTNLGVFYPESATTSTHEYFVPETASILPSRECDFDIMFDVDTSKGRKNFRIFVASNGFAAQHKSAFNCDSLAHSELTAQGGLSTLKREVIALGGTFYRLIVKVRKTNAAGLTSLFASLQVCDDSGNDSYLGDITKGVILRNAKCERLSITRRIDLSGTAPSSNAGSAYVGFTPITKGGQGTLVYSLASAPGGWSINSSTGAIANSNPSAGINTVVIRCTGSDGTFTDYSQSINIVALSAPVNSVAPAITGTIAEGSIATCSTGTWTGNPTPTYAYQWKRGATNIGTNSSTYLQVQADIGQNITCVVTATNSQGSASATSNTAVPTLPANLLGTATNINLWNIKTGVSTTNGGASNQAMMELTPSTEHKITLNTLPGAANGATYRVRMRVAIVGGRNRGYFTISRGDSAATVAIYFNLTTTPTLDSPILTGGVTMVGTPTIVNTGDNVNFDIEAVFLAPASWTSAFMVMGAQLGVGQWTYAGTVTAGLGFPPANFFVHRIA